MTLHRYFLPSLFLIAAALAACAPSSLGGGGVDMSRPKSPGGGITNISSVRTATGALLRIAGTFSSPSMTSVLIDNLPAELTPETDSNALVVLIPPALSQTTVPLEVEVAIYTSDDEVYARAVIAPASLP